MGDQKIIIISAMSQDGVIGSGEGMPWAVAEEYQQYLDFIRAQTVIMGRRSYKIFGSDLTSKTNIMVSRTFPLDQGPVVMRDFESALGYAKTLPEDIFIAGGATVYKTALQVADALYLSYIKGDFHGDVYFPTINWKNWEAVRQTGHPQFEFVEYRRIWQK